MGKELLEKVKAKLAEQEEEIKLLVNDGSYLPRTKLNAKNAEIELLQNQLRTKDEEINDYKNKIKDFNIQLESWQKARQATGELQNRIKELQTANKLIEEDLKSKYVAKEQKIKSELIRTKKQAALQVALKDTRYPDLLLGKVDYEQISIDDQGNLTGLENVVSGLKENYPALFAITRIKGKGLKPTKDNVPGKYFTME
ncbi:phage scaffolding protein [Halocella sp. SP3-1]|uniref:phage scaffolding protein n=1 Tax=Halocella sp. SP3-1 TaxID=2382161 RepID=UPI0013DF8D27|nr:phage scaffolding protein [Halocella sp. SP3-1]